ncbi:hypothetical protein ACIBI3_43925 [Actinomadura luteofluorescens]|uniref:hypothetical protein n=1 Tax=Actinomadura luteofluorescens TaxID=46163 RepID=UPI003483BDD3
MELPGHVLGGDRRTLLRQVVPAATASAVFSERGRPGAAMLKSRPAAHVALHNPSGVADLLDVLRAVGAADQVAALVQRAAQAALDNPPGVVTVLKVVQATEADDQVAALGGRAAAKLVLGCPHEAAEILAMTARGGSDRAGRRASRRLSAAGLFAQFVATSDRRGRFRFGRDSDGSAAASWSWENLR